MDIKIREPLGFPLPSREEEEKFMDECPAWARKSGVRTLLQWQVAQSIVTLDWPKRFDRLDEMRFVVEKVLRAWDSSHDN